MIEYFKLDVAIKEAQRCSNEFDNHWSVMPLEYGKFDVVLNKEIMPRHRHKILYTTKDEAELKIKLINEIGEKPLTNHQKELFENLWTDLFSLYQSDKAMSENGIPFIFRIKRFMLDYLDY